MAIIWLSVKRDFLIEISCTKVCGNLYLFVQWFFGEITIGSRCFSPLALADIQLEEFEVFLSIIDKKIFIYIQNYLKIYSTHYKRADVYRELYFCSTDIRQTSLCIEISLPLI